MHGGCKRALADVTPSSFAPRSFAPSASRLRSFPIAGRELGAAAHTHTLTARDPTYTVKSQESKNSTPAETLPCNRTHKKKL